MSLFNIYSPRESEFRLSHIRESALRLSHVRESAARFSDFGLTAVRGALAALGMLLGAGQGWCLPAEHYAANSALASGKWARVKVSSAGMNVITDAQLRNLGFSNPQAVHVYGQGGQAITFGLRESDPDDLPLIPSVRTSKGLVFFATDNITWTRCDAAINTPYAHDIHPYCDDTYYFVSDRPLESDEMGAAPATAGAGDNPLTTFTERLLHEKELEPAGDSGSQVYGEDFRTKSSQTFSFNLPGQSGDKAMAYVRFAAKTTNGSSSLIFKANGTQLPSTKKDVINAVPKKDYYCLVTETFKEMEGIREKLDLTIDFSYSGALFNARLDYIEVFYERELALDNGELHFYIDAQSGEGVSVAGCSEQTVIWDVTDPVRPLKVDYTLSGGKALFTTTTRGAREYVAFNPESVSRQTTSAGTVANQDIHGLETPDMVIITLPDYRAGAERIATFHEEHDGMRVHVLDADKIYNEFSGGKTDFLAFRRMLKMWHDRGESPDGHKIGYCLLMGKPLYDNKCVSNIAKSAGFKPMPIWQSYEGQYEEKSFSNDDIIGMLGDCTPATFSMSSATIHVAVGRLPVTNAKESDQMATKIIKYATEPDFGHWRNKVMIIADDSDDGQHFNQAQNVYRYLRSAGNGRNYIYDRNYLDIYPRVITGTGPTYPQATARMLRNYNEGVMLTNYIGHASAKGWGHERLWEWESITSMTNKRLTFIYAATCGFAYWDRADRSGAEHLMLNPDAGVIGMMAATRTVYISNNGMLNNATMDGFFRRDTDGGPRRFGDVYIEGKNDLPKDDNKLRYAFMGDPALRIPGGAPSVNVTSLNGTDMTGAVHHYPELAAMSTAEVEGTVNNPDGSVMTDFNGTVSLQLYDSERVVTTLGQGDRGKVFSYNDRDKMLSATTAKVTAGRWKTMLRVPPEIQDNYTTALISCYAWSDSGIEANGACEKLYVTGYDDSVTDTEGPVIETFYVNSPLMGADDVVNSNPIVFARLRDESGINISQSGIGHSLTLAVDGKEFFNDLATYYTQDSDDPDAGTLVYPLSGVTPGRHTLTLTAWDNANNVSKASLEITIGAAVDPVIRDITASTSTATSGVDFKILIDRPNTEMVCTLGVYDLMGRRIWDTSQTLSSDVESVINTSWDLRDKGGTRVPRGIYIYRATIESAEGTQSSKSKKIAVTAESK